MDWRGELVCGVTRVVFVLTFRFTFANGGSAPRSKTTSSNGDGLAGVILSILRALRMLAMDRFERIVVLFRELYEFPLELEAALEEEKGKA